MNNRPTPETDAALYPMNGVDIVWPDFARRLERERDEAREERDQIKQLLAADSERVDAYLGVCIERDEAREKYDALATEHMLAVNKLCKERDEARAEIQRLRLDAQREAEHHDRMVKELEELYDKLKS